MLKTQTQDARSSRPLQCATPRIATSRCWRWHVLKHLAAATDHPPHIHTLYRSCTCHRGCRHYLHSSHAASLLRGLVSLISKTMDVTIQSARSSTADLIDTIEDDLSPTRIRIRTHTCHEFRSSAILIRCIAHLCCMILQPKTPGMPRSVSM